MSEEYSPPPMFRAVQVAQEALQKRYPNGLPVNAIGVYAWNSLTSKEQEDAFPDVLGEYVSRVNAELNDARLERDVLDPSKTYLEDMDVEIAWDAAAHKPDEWGEVTIPKDMLQRILLELELLQNRRGLPGSPDGAPVLRLVTGHGDAS